MASLRTRVDPTALNLLNDMLFADIWADTSRSGVTARASIAVRYTGNANAADDLATPAPVVLDVCVDKDECVFPMVPAGGANTDMILAPPTREIRDRAEKSQTGF